MQAFRAVTIFERPDGRLSSVGHPDLSQDRLQMNLDRCFGNVALTGDHLVGKSLYQVPENLLFTLRQAVTNSNGKRVVESTSPRLIRHDRRDRQPSRRQSEHRTGCSLMDQDL